jgi:hypothetical protein
VTHAAGPPVIPCFARNMPRLYFMHREFAGRCLALDEAIENHDVQLLFDDSWYWLHYRFFNCRDVIASESSAAVRTHLYNLAAMIYRGFDELIGTCGLSEDDLQSLIKETIEVAEYSREFPISLWIYGDKTSKELLDEWLAPLPPKEQIEQLLKLPHFERMEAERLNYRFISEEQALKRFRNELAEFNKRNKRKVKNAQRQKTKAEQDIDPKS